MLLCHIDPPSNLIDCAQLLINCKINVGAKDNFQKNALYLLCRRYRQRNFQNVAQLLVDHMKNLNNIEECVNILRKQNFHEESDVLCAILETTRL